MMPRVSGFELVRHIQSLHPRPTLMIAGGDHAHVSRLDDSRVRRMLRKPFDIDPVVPAAQPDESAEPPPEGGGDTASAG